MVETFGPMALCLDPEWNGDKLTIPVTGMRFCGVKMPRMFWPRSQACEYQADDGQFAFDISACAPVVGVLLRYYGRLDVGLHS